MKKNILGLFLLLALVLSPVLATNKAQAQSTTSGQNSVGCVVLNVPPILKLGSKGAEVTKAQKALIALGYLKVSATGFYGFKTKAAVTQLQINYGIKPYDGTIGPVTAKWIYNLICNQSSQNSTTSNQQPNQQQTPNQQQNTPQQNTQTPNQQNQNPQQNQQPGVTQNLTAPCLTNTTAFVEVDSPNGGEVYNSTDKLEVKWSTCNIPTPDTKIRVALLHLNDVVMTADVLNTGSHIFVLTPALIMNPVVPPAVPIAFDKLFKVQVAALGINGTPSDVSDNTFAILDVGQNPNTTNNPNANPNQNNPNPGLSNANPNLGWPLGCVWPLTVINNLNGQPCVKPVPGVVNNPVGNIPTTAADVCASSPQPHVVVAVPNNGGKFVIGDVMDTMWFNCNVPAGVDIQISLIQTTNTGTTQYLLVKQTPNDGLESVKLVSLPGSPVLVPGDNYQLRLDFVFTPAYTGPANPAWLQWGADMSDAFFTLVQ